MWLPGNVAQIKLSPGLNLVLHGESPFIEFSLGLGLPLLLSRWEHWWKNYVCCQTAVPNIKGLICLWAWPFTSRLFKAALNWVFSLPLGISHPWVQEQWWVEVQFPNRYTAVCIFFVCQSCLVLARYLWHFAFICRWSFPILFPVITFKMALVVATLSVYSICDVHGKLS